MVLSLIIKREETIIALDERAYISNTKEEEVLGTF